MGKNPSQTLQRPDVDLCKFLLAIGRFADSIHFPHSARERSITMTARTAIMSLNSAGPVL